MKYLLLVIGIMFYLACSNEKGKIISTDLKTDTAWTVVAYSFDWNLNDHRITTARRIIQEMYKLIPLDSSGGKVTSENRLIKDTIYLVPLFEPVLDSLKKPFKMVNGKDSSVLKWAKLPTEYLLVDYNKRFK